MENIIKQTPHKTWHKFEKWLTKTFGKDLYSEWKFMEFPQTNGKIKKIKYRDFNEYELSKRLSGYEAMCKIEKYINKYQPEIRIVKCDDSMYAGSFILLIPHPTHGITVMFIPQCTSIQNQFFLYEGHFKMLMKELTLMKKIYKEKV